MFILRFRAASESSHFDIFIFYGLAADAMGSFHVKSMHFRIKSDMTNSDFDEIWSVDLIWKKIIPDIVDILNQRGLNYGSVNFLTQLPQTPVSVKHSLLSLY